MQRTTTAAVLPFLIACPLAAQDGVSQAGAAQARLFARRGLIPPPSTFVIADIVNERRHELPLPARGEPLSLDLRFCRQAGSDRTAVLQVGIATGAVPDPQSLRPVNLALAIDTSGSMQHDRKLERVREALLAFADHLRPGDRVALVAWSDEAMLLRPSLPVGDGHDLRRSIRELRPRGSTNLHGGLMCALTEVARTRVAGGTNRVILLTDGIANRGVTDGTAIAADASLLAAAGIDIATIGFGQDAQVELLREIAAAGRSAFHFVADGEDIAKVFVREAQSLLSPVARRLRLELELDPHLRVVRVLGPEVQDGRLDGRLEDMNHHASQVVLVEVQLTQAPHGKRRFPARAHLRFVDAATGEERTLTRVASLPEAGEDDAARDVDVRRNLAIAQLAVAMREMATECHAGRNDAARRVLGAAIGAASRDPQVGGHPDVARVIATAARYRDVLEPLDQGSADR